ncbi:low molecular weight protein-tyrosine-phosphatase [Cutibacterium sp.]|uniref:low molecular weight protein-tyrosine-phosphatase n=1 Tax=Cutibacterium sp. TaxID=1912221 RepID=UPI0026DBE704|nr:low molecular weight protein-tyrosine-phosphatase [Cutibacterium sp.]MDO4412342.1 low molecular weight protein-tyrosine-phosphatase [Cutibacterium sp.]
MSNQNIPSVIFVCWGNICRSPMAEFVAKKVFADEGVTARISSAGVSDEEHGGPMDSRATSVLTSHGYACSGHHAHQIDACEIMAADLVIAAEPHHIQIMKQMAPDANNLHLIRDYDPTCTPGSCLPDPWYGSADGFEDTLDAIEAAMPGIVDAVRRLA